jgi:hypothetical protein
MHEAVVRDALLLRDQYSLYDPDLTICCGKTTAWLFRNFVLGSSAVAKKSRDGVIYYPHGRGYVIDFKHPQARIAHETLHRDLIAAVHETRT